MYKLKLAYRYLFRRRISYMAVVSVALCVFMVVVVMTVMSGLVTQFKEKNHKFYSDCIVSSPSLVGFPFYDQFAAELEKRDFIKGVSPVIQSWALLTPTGSDRNRGVEIMGFDPRRHCEVTDFAASLYYHKSDCNSAFRPPYDPNRAGLIVGIQMVGMRSGMGSYTHDPIPPRYELAISCFPLNAKGSLTKLATGLVNTKVFYFSDDSQTGLPDADNEQVYVDFNDLQALCGMNIGEKRTTALFIKFQPGTDIAEGTRQVSAMWDSYVTQHAQGNYVAILKNVRVQSWKDYARAIIAPLEKEETMMMVLFGLVGIITVFIIFVIFYMIVMHKTKDIGILKSSGAGSRDVLQLFLLVAGMIGALGCAIGSTAGVLFISNINKIENWLYQHFGFQLWDRSMYAIEAIPDRLEPWLFAVIFAAAILACMAGALIPAYKASSRRPAEILQVNQL